MTTATFCLSTFLLLQAQLSTGPGPGLLPSHRAMVSLNTIGKQLNDTTFHLLNFTFYRTNTLSAAR